MGPIWGLGAAQTLGGKGHNEDKPRAIVDHIGKPQGPSEPILAYQVGNPGWAVANRGAFRPLLLAASSPPIDQPFALQQPTVARWEADLGCTCEHDRDRASIFDDLTGGGACRSLHCEHHDGDRLPHWPRTESVLWDQGR